MSIDEIQQQHVRIMQLLDLSTVLPLIQEKKIVPQEDYDKVADTKHHGSIERTGYLLHSLYKQGQEAIDKFVQCLHETKEENPKHSEILQLFHGGLPDLPSQSPLFEILENSLDDIERFIEFMPFLNTLHEAEVITLSKLLDLQSADRPIKENLERLIRTLEDKESEGFVSFLKCLQKEGASQGHQHLFELLFEKGDWGDLSMICLEGEVCMKVTARQQKSQIMHPVALGVLSNTSVYHSAVLKKLKI